MIPLPDKKYSIIYADPPWSYQNRGTRAAASKHYGTMTVDQLKKMGVGAAGGGIANSDCALFMWATFPMLREALEMNLPQAEHFIRSATENHARISGQEKGGD